MNHSGSEHLLKATCHPKRNTFAEKFDSPLKDNQTYIINHYIIGDCSQKKKKTKCCIRRRTTHQVQL